MSRAEGDEEEPLRTNRRETAQSDVAARLHRQTRIGNRAAPSTSARTTFQINDWCTRGKDMLAMHPIHLSNGKAVRSLAELEHFLADLSTIHLDDLQHTSTPEPLRVSASTLTLTRRDGVYEPAAN